MEKVDVEGWDRRMCTWSEWWGKWMWRNGTARYVHGQADVGVTWRNGTEDAESGCGGMGQEDVERWGRWMWRGGTCGWLGQVAVEGKEMGMAGTGGCGGMGQVDGSDGTGECGGM